MKASKYLCSAKTIKAIIKSSAPHPPPPSLSSHRSTHPSFTLTPRIYDAYQRETADEDHKQNESLEVLVFRQDDKIPAHVVPPSPDTRISVAVTAKAVAVAGGWTAVTHFLFGGACICVYRDNRVTLGIMWWRARGNSRVNITNAEVFAVGSFRTCRLPRIAVQHNWS